MTRIDAEDRGAAFEALFNATYARVLSYARGMADPHDADDAVSEASRSRGGGWTTCRTAPSLGG